MSKEIGIRKPFTVEITRAMIEADELHFLANERYGLNASLAYALGHAVANPSRHNRNPISH